MTDQTPPRRLHPVDPTYDDTPPPQDTAAEQALLATLINNPELGETLHPEIEPTDFTNPHHTTIWTTWHHLHQQDGTPPDPITLNAALLTNKEHGPARLLPTLTTHPATPTLAHQYAKLVRDNARRRTLDTLGTSLRQLARQATPDNLEHHLGEALQRLDDTITRWGPRTTTPNTTGLHDLTWILTGQGIPPTPPPTYATRTDGTALFYKGRVNGVFGDPESGKTWLALIAGIEALQQGGTFAMIDVDHNGADHTVGRLLLLGAHPQHLADPNHFRYYEPEEAHHLHAAITEITNLAPDVVLLDSIGELLPMLGVKSVDNDEITAALRTIVMPPAKAGSCVIGVDHLPKSAEARTTGYAIGGTAKKRAIDGAYLRAEARQQPTPGGIGRITLRIEKDRTGQLRKSSGGGYAGDFTLDSTNPAITTWTIGRPERPTNPDGTFRPTTYMEKVATYVANNPECSGRDIEAAITGTAKYIREALNILITEGHITRIRGPQRSWLHTLTIPYREAEDDAAHPTI